MRKDNIKAVLHAKKKKGQRIGQIPFGKRLSADGVHLELHPEEQAALARMKALRRDGWSFDKIAAILTEEGHEPRGERWHKTTIARLIKRMKGVK